MCVHSPIKTVKVPVSHHRAVARLGTAFDRRHGQTVQHEVVAKELEQPQFFLLDLEVDGLMTDRPAVLKQVLTDRGQWVDPV